MDARIRCVALGRNASSFENEGLKIFRAGVLAGGGSGFARNIFFHQSAAIVVGASVETELREFAIQLHPRDLNVVDRSCEQQARQRVNFQMLGESGAGAREALLEEQRILMHEAERDEFGEASRFALNLAQQTHLADPMRGTLSVSVHERRGRADAATMRRTNDFGPLRGRKLVGRQDVANFVVENLCGGAGESAESVVAQ